MLQLRGYLIGPKCGKVLTGSASKGRSGKYYYYHCNATCGTRYKAENANDLFSKELKKFVPRKGKVEVFKEIIQKQYSSKTKAQREDVKEVEAALDKATNELLNARHLLLSNEIEPSEYRSIKSEYEKKIAALESRLMELSNTSQSIIPILEKALENLCSLDTLYEHTNNRQKREIIGSIYPEKLVFDGLHYRTSRLNEGVSLIYSLGKGLEPKENGQTESNIDLSTSVHPTVQFSNHFIPDLTRLANLMIA